VGQKGKSESEKQGIVTEVRKRSNEQFGVAALYTRSGRKLGR